MRRCSEPPKTVAVSSVASRLTATSVRNTKAAEYLARAKDAHAKATAESDETVRTRLLNDAALWERMACYEEITGGRR